MDKTRAIIRKRFKQKLTWAAAKEDEITALLYIVKTGCQWRYLPETFGN